MRSRRVKNGSKLQKTEEDLEDYDLGEERKLKIETKGHKRVKFEGIDRIYILNNRFSIRIRIRLSSREELGRRIKWIRWIRWSKSRTPTPEAFKIPKVEEIKEAKERAAKKQIHRGRGRSGQRGGHRRELRGDQRGRARAVDARI